MDRLTLSFPKGLEEEFRLDYARKSVPHVRLGIGVAIALWSVFGLLDPLMIPEVKASAWMIRYLFVVPSLLAIFLFTFSGNFYRYSQPAAAAAFLICSFALTVMVSLVIRPGGTHPYTSGLLLCAPCCCVIFRMRFVNGVSAVLASVLADNAAALAAGVPAAVIVNNGFFLVSASVLGLLAGYNMETYIRHDFLQRRAVEKSSEQVNALRDVGQSVGSTLDLDTVLKTIVTHAVEPSGTNGGAIYEYDEATQAFHLRTSHGLEAELVEVLLAAPIPRNQGALGHAVATLRPVQIPDILETPELLLPRARPVLTRLGHRSLLAVPLRREQTIFGGLVVSRHQVGSFSDETVNLLQAFAAQSGLAIYNARLFRETEDKGQQL